MLIQEGGIRAVSRSGHRGPVLLLLAGLIAGAALRADAQIISGDLVGGTVQTPAVPLGDVQHLEPHAVRLGQPEHEQPDLRPHHEHARRAAPHAVWPAGHVLDRS
jgi:hypothetical protein